MFVIFEAYMYMQCRTNVTPKKEMLSKCHCDIMKPLWVGRYVP